MLGRIDAFITPIIACNPHFFPQKSDAVLKYKKGIYIPQNYIEGQNIYCGFTLFVVKIKIK